MANVLHRTTKQYLQSLNTPDYPVLDWIINPDLSSVGIFQSRYWIITGDVVTLMDQAGRDVVDADILAEGEIASKIATKATYMAQRDLKALALIIMDELNILRAFHSLSDRTPSQIKAAYDNKVDTL